MIIRTTNTAIDFEKSEDFSDFSNLNKTHEIFKNTMKKFDGKSKNETQKTIYLDEFIALKSKTYSFECNDKSTKKLKRVSESYS